MSEFSRPEAQLGWRSTCVSAAFISESMRSILLRALILNPPRRTCSWGGENEDRHLHGFSNTTLDAVKKKIRRFRIDNIELVPGFFDRSFPKFPADVGFSFAHLDVNLYDSYRDCLHFCYPELSLAA